MVKLKQFKIARRLGAPIFPKCDNPHFSTIPKTHGKSRKFSSRSEYGVQLLEKQKARYSYGLSEKQFVNYVRRAMKKHGSKPTSELFMLLETRLDNVVYRLGLAVSRRFARQLVSHGHILVNGQRITIPSFSVKKDDVISIKKGSIAKPLFENITERLKEHTPPSWLSFDATKKEGVVLGVPASDGYKESLLNLHAVIEFYSR